MKPFPIHTLLSCYNYMKGMWLTFTAYPSCIAAVTGKQQYTGGGTETGYLTKLVCYGSSGGFAAWYSNDVNEGKHLDGTVTRVNGVKYTTYSVDTQNGARGIYLWQRGGMSGVTVNATYTSPNGGTYVRSIPYSEWHYDGETSDGDSTDHVIISASNGNVPKQATWK